jgi:hypothetical protein
MPFKLADVRVDPMRTLTPSAGKIETGFMPHAGLADADIAKVFHAARLKHT